MKRRPGIRRLFRLAARTRVDNVVDEELAHHLQECADFLIERGYDRAEAYREARRRFGDVSNYRSACVAMGRRRQRRIRIVEFTQSIIQDIRFAARGMRRYPSFTISVLLTLALGIGANAAIYTIVDATLLRPPPYPNARSLANVTAELEGGIRIPSWPTRIVEELQRASDFPLVGHTNRRGARTDLAIPEVFDMYLFQPNIFEVLGVHPMLGRPFTANDVGPQAEAVAVLSHRYWRARLSADPGVVGQVIRIDDAPVRVVGVLPPGLKFPHYNRADAWLPIDQNGVLPGTDTAENRLDLVAFVDSTQSAVVVESQLNNVVRGLVASGDLRNGVGVSLTAVSDDRINPDSRRALWILAGACALIWLIAVVNGTNLFLVRNSFRVTELKVRLALGAGRGRIARQIMTEAVVIALLSGLVSSLGTAMTMGGIVALLPSEITTFSPNVIDVSSRVFWFVFGVASLTGLLFGLVPTIAAFRETRSGNVSHQLSTALSSRSSVLVRNGLVIAEVTMAVILLIGATLLARSFVRLSNVDPGFDAEGILTMSVSLPESRYDEPESRQAFRENVLTRLRAIPGVEAATEGSGLPSHAGFSFGGDSIGTDDGNWHITSDMTWISVSRVDQYALDMLDIEVLAGRDFQQTDHGRDDVVIIDEALARWLFGTAAAAVGRRMQRGREGTWETIVGVTRQSLLLSPVGSPQAFGLDQAQIAYQNYRPTNDNPGTFLTFAVQTTDGSMRVASAMREVVATVDPLQPVDEITWLADDYAETISTPRFNSFLMAVLAVVATVLTLVGVYGVLSFAVSSRTRELGIRMALGAEITSLRRLVIGSGLKLTIAGVIFGFGVAVPVSRLLRTLLYETSPTDVASFAVVGLSIIVAGALASYLPSRRATRVDPVVVLRSE